MEPRVVHEEFKPLPNCETLEKPRVGLRRLVDDLKDLAGLLHLKKLPTVAVLARNLRCCGRAGYVLPSSALHLLIHQGGKRMRLNGERRKALQLFHHRTSRRRHVAGIAPGNLEHSAAHQLLPFEQAEIEVVELQ